MIVKEKDLNNMKDPEKEVIYEMMGGNIRGITVFEGDKTVALRRSTKDKKEIIRDIPLEQWLKDIEECKQGFEVMIWQRYDERNMPIDEYGMNFRDNGEFAKVLWKVEKLISKYFKSYDSNIFSKKRQSST